MPLTVSDGALLVRDGKVGTEQACCCDQECVCPTECVEGLQVSLGNEPTCADNVYSDFVECTGGVYSVTMYCNEGIWIVSVSGSCFENGGTCFFSYEAQLECEADNLPPAGPVNLIEISLFEQDDGCPPLPPVVTIIK
jgi:hypothetical protein